MTWSRLPAGPKGDRKTGSDAYLSRLERPLIVVPLPTPFPRVGPQNNAKIQLSGVPKASALNTLARAWLGVTQPGLDNKNLLQTTVSHQDRTRSGLGSDPGAIVNVLTRV